MSKEDSDKIARLKERILDGVPMVNANQACALLGLSPEDPTATLQRMERHGEILAFTVDGQVLYPEFQFSEAERNPHRAMAAIISRAKDANFSAYRVLNWLMFPHLEFDCAPSQVLATKPDAVVHAFEREAAEEVHG